MKLAVFAIVAVFISGCVDDSDSKENQITIFENHTLENQFPEQHFSWDTIGYELVEMKLNGTGKFDVHLSYLFGQTLEVVVEGDQIECQDTGNLVIVIGGTSNTSVSCKTEAESPVLIGHFYGASAGNIRISY
jgi:hypothetical protein